MSLVRIPVWNTDSRMFIRGAEVDETEVIQGDIGKYAKEVARLMSSYFLYDTVTFGTEVNKGVSHAAAVVRIFLKEMKLPVPHGISYTFFIDFVMTRNVPPRRVAEQRLQEFVMLVDTKLKGMGHSVKWVLPNEKMPPTEVVGALSFDDVIGTLLQ